LRRVLGGVMLLTAMAVAQDHALRFEVASVKPTAPLPMGAIANGQAHFRSDDHRFEDSYATLRGLAAEAYGVDWNRISGPAWMNEQHYAIAAELPARSTKEQIPEMLRTLLAERFALKAHRDSKVEAVYLLVGADSSVKLKVASPDEVRDGCSSRPGQMYCQGTTLSQLALQLPGRTNVNLPFLRQQAAADGFQERTIDKPVIDQTGLAAENDIDLQWIPPGGLPDVGQRRQGYHFPERNANVKADSIFGALEAVGLKLQPGRHTFEYLVIDQAERTPTEN
jgi:uncharacterized protein (TIGR03435 family)